MYYTLVLLPFRMYMYTAQLQFTGDLSNNVLHQTISCMAGMFPHHCSSVELHVQPLVDVGTNSYKTMQEEAYNNL